MNTSVYRAFVNELGLIKLALLGPGQAKALTGMLKKKPAVGGWLRQQRAQGGIAPFPGAKRISLG